MATWSEYIPNISKNASLAVVVGMVAASAILTAPREARAQRQADRPDGMIWIPGGVFTMGSPESDGLSQAVERPAHAVIVDGFWMDETEVTNAQFAKFVVATGYVTLAEKKPEWEEIKKQVPPGTPKPPDEVLQPGSLVFTPPNRPVPLDNIHAWW